jgi:hypothetical protein
MSSEVEFFDKLEPLASLVKEKPSPVIQKELIVSPENSTTVHKKLVIKLANEIDLTKTENLAGEIDQKNNLKTIPGASINLIPTER